MGRFSGEGVYLRSLVEAIAQFEFGYTFSETGGEVGVDSRLNIDAVGADTGLATATELAQNCG
jgi:hypothetical protein